jgi:CIC family chloride channel protein
VQISDWRLVLAAALLGLLCAFGSLGFRHALRLGRELFDRTRLPLPVRLGAGGLLVGLIGIAYPEVWGNGYEVLKSLTAEPTPEQPLPGLQLVLMLVVLKTVATGISTGSGALGGVFTPNLVVGGAFGSLFGNLVMAVWPDSGDHRVAFALVGMAGLCAATTHAPITAILLIFEMTDDYHLILPLMLCSIAGSGIARMLDTDSIYTARLRARGHDLSSGIEKTTMQVTFVRDLLRRDVLTVADTAGFDEVMERFGSARTNAVYVVDAAGALLGHIQLHDVKYYINDPSLGSVVIAADLTRPAPTALPDETIASVLPRFDDPDLGELAVVARDAAHRLLGRITRRDVVALLSDTVVGRAQLRARIAAEGDEPQTHLELPPGSVMKRVDVPDAYVGRTLGSLDDFEDGRLVAVLLMQRDELGHEQRRVAAPNEPLPAGAALFIVGAPEAVERFESGA